MMNDDDDGGGGDDDDDVGDVGDVDERSCIHSLMHFFRARRFLRHWHEATVRETMSLEYSSVR